MGHGKSEYRGNERSVFIDGIGNGRGKLERRRQRLHSAIQTVQIHGIAIAPRSNPRGRRSGTAHSSVMAQGPDGWGPHGRHGRKDRRVDIAARVLLLPLGASILEPDLHLGLRKVEGKGEVQPLADGEVSRLAKLILERDELFVREGRSDAAWLALPALVRVRTPVLVIVIVVVVLVGVLASEVLLVADDVEEWREDLRSEEASLFRR